MVVPRGSGPNGLEVALGPGMRRAEAWVETNMAGVVSKFVSRRVKDCDARSSSDLYPCEKMVLWVDFGADRGLHSSLM